MKAKMPDTHHLCGALVGHPETAGGGRGGQGVREVELAGQQPLEHSSALDQQNRRLGYDRHALPAARGIGEGDGE